MELWIFLLCMDLLIPITMICIGKYYAYNKTKSINMVSGYRTNMSMKNEDTWVFAQKYLSRLWYMCGMILIPISVIVMLLALGKDKVLINKIGTVLCFAQVFVAVVTIIPTEVALRKRFDKNGKQKP